jgi:hypothetical protein
MAYLYPQVINDTAHIFKEIEKNLSLRWRTIVRRYEKQCSGTTVKICAAAVNSMRWNSRTIFGRNINTAHDFHSPGQRLRSSFRGTFSRDNLFEE